MNYLIWEYDPASGDMWRSPYSVALDRGVTRDLDDFDCPVEIEFEPHDDDVPHTWEPPEYPLESEHDDR